MGRWLWVLGCVLLLGACQPGGHAVVPGPSASVRQQPTPTPTSSPLPTSTPATSPSPTSISYQQRCSIGQLAATWGGRVSEPTGQHTLSLVITNTSKTGCYLFGYPNVALVDRANRVLPLQYERTGDQVVTSATPNHVDMAPGASAYVTLNKYRCDTTDLMQATEARLTPPDLASSRTVSITDNVSMDYCGPGDPGSIVHVSPVEPSYQATYGT